MDISHLDFSMTLKMTVLLVTFIANCSNRSLEEDADNSVA